MAHPTSGSGDYPYHHGGPTGAHGYLLPVVARILEDLVPPPGPLFDLGCGNGSAAAHFARSGYRVSGVDPSRQGIEQANTHYPELSLRVGSAYEDLAGRYGRFPVVYSLEVVEHVYDPRSYAAALFDLVEPAGTAVISTPFHGYWKNLALAVTGRLDSHFTALWDHGHIKFWSVRTLTRLLEEAGFGPIRFRYAGRFRPFAKSMVAIAEKP